jgi:hypothetical protein
MGVCLAAFQQSTKKIFYQRPYHHFWWLKPHSTCALLRALLTSAQPESDAADLIIEEREGSGACADESGC